MEAVKVGGRLYDSWPSKKPRDLLAAHSNPPEPIFKAVCVRMTHIVSALHDRSLKLFSTHHPKGSFLLQCDNKCDIYWNTPGALRTIVELTWTWQLSRHHREFANPPWKQELRLINQISSMEKKERKESCQGGWRLHNWLSLFCSAQLCWCPQSFGTNSRPVSHQLDN